MRIGPCAAAGRPPARTPIAVISAARAFVVIREPPRKEWGPPPIASTPLTCQGSARYTLSTMTTGPLDGLRVLDLSNQLSGPYCAMLLGDLGADVVKVEHPVGGDPARLAAPHLAGESAPFMTVNRNKRSITVDLKTPDGLAIARRLAARADVVLENWRPGAAARLGLGYDDVRRLNPRAVYCSISGFGRIAQGMSGLMSINGDVDGPPLVVPIPIADIGTGMFGLIGILAALAHR